MATAVAPEAERLPYLRLADDDDAVPGPKSGGAQTTAAATTTAVARPPPRVRALSERSPDGAAVLHYQVVDLGAQVYVWVGGGGGGPPTVPNLHFAIQQPRRAGGGGEAAVAALIPDDAASGRAEAMARRLAKRVGRPVLLSLAVPGAADPLLHALAERRLLQELKEMGLFASAAPAAAPAAAAAAAAAPGG